ncbi:substrate-binding domain-containing protein [Demequina capsici]|uniref:Substrate-binding domain-containing protein n=1 Tax=Demequina capsici TaxID=3075620 RepID=A0AA96F4H7_9MICO|nr:substrate-binding domain-containing protein [Demequina sp. OYTSA14]WNM23589.1 substrate-binding domain-containing protein [Demequina sp. OYTSA14]
MISLGDATDTYLSYVGDTVKQALEAEGCTVQILSAQNDIPTQLTQIQNTAASGTGFLYVFPAGDAQAYKDALTEVTAAGVKTLVSNNFPGDDAATAFVGADEFVMGVMMAPMVKAWLDEAYPDAAPGSVKALVLEASVIPNMVKRSAGIKIIAEKFLRQVDLSTGTYIKTDGEPVNYVDADGNTQPVDEPTGGLVLDADGNAILNPYYDARIDLHQISNRNIFAPIDAQNAIDTFVTEDNRANSDLKVVLSYGDTAAATSEKLLELSQSGVISTAPEGLATFGSDLTSANAELIPTSVDNSTVFRGVITSGDLLQTVVDTAVKMVNGETVDAVSWEKLGYTTVGADGSLVNSTYADDLPATDEFFPSN